MTGEKCGRALLVCKEEARCRWLRALLEGEGHDVLEEHDAPDALGILRGSPQPLVVVVEVHCVHILNGVLEDRRLARHHAYTVVCSATDLLSPMYEAVLANLVIRVVREPSDASALLQAVRQCAHCLPTESAYARPQPTGATN